MARKPRPRKPQDIIAQGAPKAYRGNLNYQQSVVNQLVSEMQSKSASDHQKKKPAKKR